MGKNKNKFLLVLFQISNPRHHFKLVWFRRPRFINYSQFD